MSNSINILSPDFRDFLLNKNIVSDTITDNGVLSLLNGIGKPTNIETIPISVQSSENILNIGDEQLDSITNKNLYKGDDNDYILRNIDVINTTSENILPYKFTNANIINNSNDDRLLNTKINKYFNEDNQKTFEVNYQPKSYDNLSNYFENFENINEDGVIGKQPFNILQGIARGQGIGVDVIDGGFIPNSGAGGNLAGRTLGNTIDSDLGNIGIEQLVKHTGYNASFNLQRETVGRLNTNPFDLLTGSSVFTPNNSITVRSGGGKLIDFASNISGVNLPIVPFISDISTFDVNGNYQFNHNNIAFYQNRVLKNTGVGQVRRLFLNLRRNSVISSAQGNTTLRKGYTPGYTDDRPLTSGLSLTNFIYFRGSNDGITGFMEGERNSPISSTNYELSKQIKKDGWEADYFDKSHSSVKYYNEGGSSFGTTERYEDAFGWQDEIVNKDERADIINSEINFDTNQTNTDEFDNIIPNQNNDYTKTLLYKTQQLFKSGNMKTLISGHGIKDDKSQINSAISKIGGFVSKGSGVLSGSVYGDEVPTKPENIFCRTWTTYDRYAQVLDLQKNSGLFGQESYGDSNIYRRNTEDSVLQDNGFVKIEPIRNQNLELKKYMFSLTNLAWHGHTNKLPNCEVAEDPLSGKQGRIMWFPPYDIEFSEDVSVDWNEHTFIGRGEPMYTYNNTRRGGHLSFKMIIDHPNYINYMDVGNTTLASDKLASFFAGCLPPEQLGKILSPEELNALSINNATKHKPLNKVDVNTVDLPEIFNVYFPNDVFELTSEFDNYEIFSGSTSGSTSNDNFVQAPQIGPPSLDDIVGDVDLTLPPENEILLEESQEDSILFSNDDDFNSGLKFLSNDEIYYEQCYEFGSQWSSEKCSLSKGPKGGKGRRNVNRTNFGLNSKEIKILDDIFNGWKDPNYHSKLREYLTDTCPYCKIVISGFASDPGGDDRNKVLSKLRAEFVRDYIKTNILPNIDDSEFNKRVIIKAEGSVGPSVGCEPVNQDLDGSGELKNLLIQNSDNKACKESRFTTVRFSDDVNLKSDVEDENIEIESGDNNNGDFDVSISRFFNECDYFDKLEQTDPIVFQGIKDKIRYFTPAFHSITPEGFNSRLNFLHQCTRQGPTSSVSEQDSDGNQVDNLAFGTPPICILRLGDFYHTKIVINSLNLSYDPLVWDLNPEGVGVQPMICNVDINFHFIGGSSMKGAINKLQNAVSFNYYANTEIYDKRSDIIKKNDGKWEIQEGDKGSNTNTKEESKDTTDVKSQVSQTSVNTIIDTPQSGTTQNNVNSNDSNILKFSNVIRIFYDNNDDVVARFINIDGLTKGWRVKIGAISNNQIPQIAYFQNYEVIPDSKETYVIMSKNELSRIFNDEIPYRSEYGQIVDNTQAKLTYNDIFLEKNIEGDKFSKCFKGNNTNIILKSKIFIFHFYKNGEDTIKRSQKIYKDGDDIKVEMFKESVINNVVNRLIEKCMGPKIKN